MEANPKSLKCKKKDRWAVTCKAGTTQINFIWQLPP